MYLLKCADGSLYCGWTNHLEERVQAHNAGRGAKYTKSRRPVKLAYYEVFATKQEAMRREWAVKQLSRAEKLRLIAVREDDGKERIVRDGESECAGDGELRRGEKHAD